MDDSTSSTDNVAESSMSQCTQAGTVGEGEIHSPKSDYIHWTVDQVVGYLKSNAGSLFNDEDTARLVTGAFQEHQIDGTSIPLLTRDTLGTMSIKAVGVQNKVLTLLRDLQQNIEGKVFNDPIHGHFVLHPLLVKVIDTPQFQRLRNIKQMGGGYYVYPGASHNRFEHSLGVCHIAGEFVELLQKKQPELGITGVDVLCVKMAGLCHDLGHGPFSHLFDSMFIPTVRPDIDWKHEDASITMLDHLLEENNLRPEFKRYGLEEQDIVFIKEMIIGSPLRDRKFGKTKDDPEEIQGSWRYEGRTVEKSFLYEIVTNKINGVDVDKWDYFARDGHCLGISNNFDMQRYMKFTRVILVNGRLQICARDKEINNLYVMFHTRLVLHLRASQQTTKRLIEQMMTEALIEANNHLLLSGKNGLPVKMSDAIYDMTAYTRLTDGVLHLIMASSDPKLEKSKDLLLQIERRQFYKYIGQIQPVPDKSKLAKEEIIQQQLADSLTQEEMFEQGLPELTKDDFLVQVVKFDYGKQDENPIDKMRFYAKGEPDKAFTVSKEEVSQLLPYNFQEMTVRVFCKKRDDKDSTSAALKYFQSWCKKHDLKVGTPVKPPERDDTFSFSDVKQRRLDFK